jgi:hypothetical protein
LLLSDVLVSFSVFCVLQGNKIKMTIF